MARRKKPIEDTFSCSHCGAEVKVSAKFCKACGASDESGWGEDEYLGEDEFDYDEYLRRESGASPPLTSRRALVAIVILLVCVAILMLQVFWG